MKPEVVSALNKINSSFYDEPPAEAAKSPKDPRWAAFHNAFLEDAQITDVNIVGNVTTISMIYTPKYPLEYICANFVI